MGEQRGRLFATRDTRDERSFERGPLYDRSVIPSEDGIDLDTSERGRPAAAAND